VLYLFQKFLGTSQGRTIAKRFLLVRLFGVLAVELITLLIISDLPKEIVVGATGGALVTGLWEVGYFLVYGGSISRNQNVYEIPMVAPSRL
jgi:hypothetical protein